MSRAPVPDYLLPDNATVTDGRLAIGGADVLDLAAEFGTPLFVYDEDHLRARCREAVTAFGDGVAYASKAFLSQAVARLVWEEGMHLDVATGGELHVALSAGVPADRLVMHGNNKSVAEIDMALTVGVGRIVVDSFEEIDRIERLVASGRRRPQVLVRINPGIDVHTHQYLQTGVADSKFGFGVSSGDADRAVALVSQSPAMDLVGVHAHIGSQVFVADSYSKAIGSLAPFVNSHHLEEVSIGGGLGVAYVTGESAPTITEWAASV